MADYTIEFEKRVKKDLEKVPQKFLQKILTALEGLKQNPRPMDSIKLKSPTALYRLRVGDYRIIYTIEDSRLRVLILKIGDRKEIYRFLSR